MHTSPLSNAHASNGPQGPNRIASGEPTPVQTGTVPEAAPPASGDAPVGGRDRVTVSDEGRLRARAEAAAAAATETRAELVSELREQVASGTYDLDPDAIARALVDHQERS